MADKTKKQIAGYHRRSLVKLEGLIRNMSAEWGDIDNYFMDKLADLADNVSTTRQSLEVSNDE